MAINYTADKDDSKNWSVTVEESGIYEFQTKNKYLENNINIIISPGNIREITSEDISTPIVITQGQSKVIERGFYDNDIIIKSPEQIKVSGVLSNVPVKGITYSIDETNSTSIPSEGSLYINEGYYENTKIPLSHILPDISNQQNITSSQVRIGYGGYDQNGKEVIGSMPDAEISVTGETYSYSIDKKPVIKQGSISSSSYSNTIINNADILDSLIPEYAEDKVIIPVEINTKELSIDSNSKINTSGYIDNINQINITATTVPVTSKISYIYLNSFNGKYSDETED